MTTKWAKTYLANNLSDHAPTSVPLKLVSIIDNLLSSATTPSTSASLTVTLIEAQHNISLALANLIGLYFDAAASFISEGELSLLVAYLIELAKQPDAINEGPGVKIWDAGGGEIHEIPPGAPIIVEGKRLWSDLPMFSWNVTERFQGPELYLFDLKSPATPELATAKWKHFNTLLALIAHSPNAQTIPSLAGYNKLARVTLSMALEHSPNTRLGRNTALHVPAAAQWFSIAEEEIERMCELGTERMTAGDLWMERGGSEVVDGERLGFWRGRMEALGW